MFLLVPMYPLLDISTAQNVEIFFFRRNYRLAGNLAQTPSFGGVVSGFRSSKNQADCTDKSPFPQKRPLRTPLVGLE